MALEGIWLASASKRRYAILNALKSEKNYQISIIAEPLLEDEIKPSFPTLKESVFSVNKMKLENAMMEISLGRLKQLNFKNCENVVSIVSDTLVEDPNTYEQIFGKPDDELEALNMLKSLSGRRHKVWSSTGIIIHDSLNLKINQRPEIISGNWLGYVWTDYSIVEFEDFTDEVLMKLLQSNSWVGKAGAYDLDGKMSKYSKLISGEKINVLGFSENAINTLEYIIDVL